MKVDEDFKYKFTEEELKFWNEQLNAFDDIKEELKQIQTDLKKERAFVIFFFFPFVVVGFIGRFIFEALKKGWSVGLSVVEYLG